MTVSKTGASAQPGPAQRAGKRIAVVVPNPCNPDYRVIKQAESLARAGYEVTIFATKKSNTPTYEELAGVRYIRRPWNLRENFRQWMSGAYQIVSEYADQRAEYRKMLKAAEAKAKKNRDQNG